MFNHLRVITFYLLCLLFSSATIKVFGVELPVKQKPVKVFILAGQSNALGYDDIDHRKGQGNFGAYYTQVNTGKEFEKFSRTGEHADIVVTISHPEGRLVFGRASSYLPYWETSLGKWYLKEILPRHGDGEGLRTDRVNAFSNVAIIENSSDRVLVRWRYLPQFEPGNPPAGVSPESFAEELFEIRKDGKIVRTVKQGTARIEDWNDPLNQTTQVIQLKADQIKEVMRQYPSHSPGKKTVKGRPVNGQPIVPPVWEWRFDEGSGNQTVEQVSGIPSEIKGRGMLWRKGISGTALEFDGYSTEVSVSAGKLPPIDGGSLTLEGWVALGAYPWNWTPVIQQGDDDGCFLGVNSYGYPGFMVKIGGVWEQLTVQGEPPYTDLNHLLLFKWYHLAGTYSKQNGIIRLYVNGKEVANKPVGRDGVQHADTDVRVGKAGILREPVGGVFENHPSSYSFDGLIDEIRAYNVALNDGQIAESFSRFNPAPDILGSPDIEKRGLPLLKSRKFGAAYTLLPYYESWDNLFRFGPYADVVVGFDRLPVHFVFWHGVSYIPMMVNEAGQWFTQEFSETGFNPDAPGDCEPMSDKACYHSHVRVLENTPARVVVEWRYQLENSNHYWAFCNAETGWGDVADWYFYIYPDGVASVRQRLYSSQSDSWHEWNEQIAVLGEGQHPESVIKKEPVMTLVDTAVNATSYGWNPVPPAPDYAGKIIQMIHLTGRYSLFAIQKFDGGDIYSGSATWYSVFPCWNHWPTAQVNSSARIASFPDRASHSSLSHLFYPVYKEQGGDVPFQEKLLLQGLTDLPATDLTNLANSWLKAPSLEAISDCRSTGYDQSQRAYILYATGASPSFRIAASAGRPVVNPCFVVENWDSEKPVHLKIDSKTIKQGSGLRQGLVRNSSGKFSVVLWLEGLWTEPSVFSLRGNANRS